MSSRRSSSLALAQLIRLPAVFTALSDIAMSTAVAWASRATFSWATFSLLLLISGCVYSAGMVLNDVADVQIDRRERPFRPIPSGRIRGGTALTLGGILLLIGLAVSAAERSEVHARYSRVAAWWLRWSPTISFTFAGSDYC